MACLTGAGSRWAIGILLVVCLKVAVASDELFGVAYAPYRYMGVCPHAGEIQQDLCLMKKYTTKVRTYSTECPEVLDLLFWNGFRVLIGVWIDNRASDQKEIDDLIQILRRHPQADIHGIVVGNEALYRETMTPTEVANRVKETRRKVRALAEEVNSDVLRNVDIFSVEVFPHPEVVAVSDAVGANIHPFYNTHLAGDSNPENMAGMAVMGTMHSMDMLKSYYPGKRFIVAEVGWPTDSKNGEAHEGKMDVTKHFMKKWPEYARNMGIEYFWFELCDSEWKKSMVDEPDDMSDFHFGIFRSDRSVKEMASSETSGC
ncbi:hypothetical protein BSKO_05038 [Bryopsis sp. KO-2023]|nr:hypothetical protein BSKO_05038 [Bryopsis sp. KO-2023]